jgi:hypothetical protein
MRQAHPTAVTSVGVGAVIAVGEIHTALLPTSQALTLTAARGLLESVAGEGTAAWSRPVSSVTSSTRLTGVDCALPTVSAARVRGVGTVESRLSVVAGRVIQGAAQARLVSGTDGRRRPWSHYLARPGTVEVLTRWQQADVVTGLLSDYSGSGLLSLDAVSGRGMDDLQADDRLDRNPPVALARRRLRWVAQVATGDRPSSRLEVTVVSALESRAWLVVPESDLPLVGPLCADLARHDWLLASAESLLERAGVGHRPAREVLHFVRPILDHLVPVWFPAAGLSVPAQRYWRAFDVATGAREHWALLTQRVRDQVGLAVAPGGGDPPSAGIPPHRGGSGHP